MAAKDDDELWNLECSIHDLSEHPVSIVGTAWPQVPAFRGYFVYKGARE